MNIVFWILGGLVTGLVVIGIAELLKGPRGVLSPEERWWSIDSE